MILELLEMNPLSAEKVKTWFMRKMMDSMEEENIPEEFKLHMIKEGISYEQISGVIENNPAALFEFFDANDLIISVVYDSGHKVFRYRVDQKDVVNQYEIESNDFSTRKEAEAEAVSYSFKTLEAILCETK